VKGGQTSQQDIWRDFKWEVSYLLCGYRLLSDRWFIN